MTEIRCTVPLRVRIAGDPMRLPAEELESQLAQTIGGRIDQARSEIARAHGSGLPEHAFSPTFRFPDGLSEEARDHVQRSIQRAIGRALAGERGTGSSAIRLVSLTTSGKKPAAPRARRADTRPWLILRAINFHARLGDFLEVVIDIRPELASSRMVYLEHLDEVRWVEAWLVRVNRPYLLSEIYPILHQRAIELGHVHGKQTIAVAASPHESLRQKLAGIDRDSRVSARIPDLTPNAAHFQTQGGDTAFEAGALILFAWMIIPKVELADYVSLGSLSRLGLPLVDLADVMDPDAFQRFFHVPLTTFMDEVPDARGTLVIAPFTVHRRVLSPTLNALLSNAIQGVESATAFRSGNVELLNDTLLSRLPSAAQSAVTAATDAATRALPDDAIDNSWQPKWRGAAIYALFEPTAEQIQAARYRPAARAAADQAVAWLQRDTNEFVTRLGLLSWLKKTFDTSDPLYFEYFLADLDGRNSGRWFARLFDVGRETKHGELIQILLVRALATRYALDPRVQALYLFFNQAHVSTLRHAYSIEKQAIQLDRSGAWVGVNEILADTRPIYSLKETRKVLHEAKRAALATATSEAAKELLGKIFRGEETKEFDEQTFLATVIATAAEKVGLSEQDFDDVVFERSIRLRGIDRKVVDAIDHYWIHYDLVERINGGEWTTVNQSATSKTDSALEEEIWWWVYRKTAKVVEIMAIGVSVLAVAAIALEAGAVALLIKAAGGMKVVLISIALSELIYLARVIFTEQRFTWEDFFIAALEGYLTALTFRGAGIIGKGVARNIGTKTMRQLLLGWFAQKMTTGLIGGASTGAVVTFTHGIFGVILRGDGMPGVRTYVRNMAYGAVFGMAVELGVGVVAPVLRVGGDTALQTIEQAATSIRKAGFSPERWAVISAQMRASIRTKLNDVLVDVAVQGIDGAFTQKLSELLRWYGGEARLALLQRVLELSPEALSTTTAKGMAISERAAAGMERLALTSPRFLADQALLDVLNSVPGAQLRRVLEAVSVLRPDALAQLLRTGQLPRIAASPQLVEFVSRDVTIANLIAQEAAHGTGIATFRITRLLALAEKRSNLPAEFRRGAVAFRRADGKPIIYEVEGHPDLYVKPGGGRLPRESMAMVELELLGIPTVYGSTVVVEGQTQMLIQRLEGVGSKDIIGRASAVLRPYRNTEVVTQRTIDDLHKISDILTHNRVRLGDFQFIVRRSDGAVIMNDPTNITFNAGVDGGQMKRIIEQFEGILRRRQRGELP